MNALKKLSKLYPKRETSIPKKTYNTVYEKLVDDEYDLVGQIAYCMYKLNKQKYIRAYEQEHQQKPSDKEMQVYVSCSELPKLKLYQEQAEKLVSTVLEQAVSEREAELSKEFEKKLKKFVYDYEPAGFLERNFFTQAKGAFSGLLGNMLTTVVIVAFLYAIAPSSAEKEFVIGASKSLIAALATFLGVDVSIK
ncbi:hypothetical protein [Vibrio tritonius]|uniref:hypothetical protein n=1 Tax=Vibrio tritonius TaxID=1435069 RepID=UPI0008390728|nr:hypothetical protein [Vibrio tritonius]